VLHARKWVCVVSSIPMLARIPAALVTDPVSALAYICVALLGYASWSTMGLTFSIGSILAGRGWLCNRVEWSWSRQARGSGFVCTGICGGRSSADIGDDKHLVSHSHELSAPTGRCLTCGIGS
jgi:hypothetical protein